MSESGTLRVETAAIRIKDEVHTLPRPARHHDLIRSLALKGFKRPIVGDQGFVLSNGQFVTRLTAAHVALASGQCKKLISPPELYTEDLW